MNLHEIISRPDSAEFTVEELHFVIEQYISYQKSIEVKIGYPPLWFMTSTSPGFKLHKLSQVKYHLLKINRAFNIAQKFFKEEGI